MSEPMNLGGDIDWRDRALKAEADLLAEKIRRANEYADAKRLIAWVRDPNRQQANTAFTEGPERQVAYWIEMSIDAGSLCDHCQTVHGIVTPSCCNDCEHELSESRAHWARLEQALEAMKDLDKTPEYDYRGNAPAEAVKDRRGHWPPPGERWMTPREKAVITLGQTPAEVKEWLEGERRKARAEAFRESEKVAMLYSESPGMEGAELDVQHRTARTIAEAIALRAQEKSDV